MTIQELFIKIESLEEELSDFVAVILSNNQDDIKAHAGEVGIKLKEVLYWTDLIEISGSVSKEKNND